MIRSPLAISFSIWRIAASKPGTGAAFFFAGDFFAGFFVISFFTVWQCLAGSSRNCPKVCQSHHQRHWFARARVEAKLDIEVLRFVRNGVNNDSTNPNGIGCLDHASCGVAEQGSAHAVSLPVAIHGEARQHG